ncbi:GldG family protein [Pseudoflavonifractor phocaeensis]|uniref:GldG family protein n=1 Tax=Pseudoflavonifractor phocaeensis TaxID=1870988 RepID=UPI001958B2CF|nr:GldG family protein [Pseudoflavonifractor phocaeensis]MBM6724038.1 GldG family protein [Pseudoflavonifractor phocaeensis]
MKWNKPNLASIKGSFRTRTFRAGGYSLAAAAVVIAIAVAVNLVVGALPADWTKTDLTSTGLYSLSSQTQQMVSALEDEVTVYWLVQSDTEDNTIGELLERYQDLSKNLKVERKDPVVYPNFAQQYTTSTLYNNSLIVTCGDRSRYISYYDIYVTDYSSYYTTGTASTQFDGESQLTSAIDYVTNEDLPVVYTLTGHGESQLPSTLSDGAAEENVLLSELSLLTQESVPEDADALIIYAPQSDISADEKDMLLTYLQSGGKLLLVTDYTETAMPNLAEVMAYYGTSLADGIVMEGDSSHHMRGSSYYLLPDIGSHDITSPLADGGYYVLMPVAQGISVSDELREGLTVTQLLTTTSASYAKADAYNLTTYDKEEGDLEGPFALGVAISEEVEGGTTGIVWLTTSYMFNDDVDMLVSGANTDLFLNALDWMCQRESSISIRAKDLSTEYLTVPSSDVSTWSLILVVTLPLAFILAGAYITVTRRKR